jgi:two-component system, NtrC family, response regulator HydG
LAFFVDKYNRKMNRRVRLHEGVLDALNRYDFPGNIRELEHMVEQAIALVQGDVATTDDLLPASPPHPAAEGGGRALSDVVDSAERTAIEAALRDSDGSREKAADLLSISPTTLWRKMNRLGITFDVKS